MCVGVVTNAAQPFFRLPSSAKDHIGDCETEADILKLAAVFISELPKVVATKKRLEVDRVLVFAIAIQMIDKRCQHRCWLAYLAILMHGNPLAVRAVNRVDYRQRPRKERAFFFLGPPLQAECGQCLSFHAQ